MKATVTVNLKVTKIEANTLRGLKMKATKVSASENTIFMETENGDRYKNQYNGRNYTGWGAKLA